MGLGRIFVLTVVGVGAVLLVISTTDSLGMGTMILDCAIFGATEL